MKQPMYETVDTLTTSAENAHKLEETVKHLTSTVESLSITVTSVSQQMETLAAHLGEINSRMGYVEDSIKTGLGENIKEIAASGIFIEKAKNSRILQLLVACGIGSFIPQILQLLNYLLQHLPTK